MTTQEVKRKLAAILSADAKGYGRLIREDELATIRTLNAYKELMTNLVQQHHGRVVDAPGDNLLAEFGSVVDAVQCAVDIQKELKVRNAELPENRKMEFRIGINLGDVIEEGERIYGDGVNIAARLEGLAEAGGIFISGTAFDQVRNKLNVGYDFRGEQTVKNVVEPVRVYKVLMEPEAAGKVIGEKKVKPRQWQRSAIGLVVVLIVVVVAVVIWKLYTPSAPQPEVTSKGKITTPQLEKPSATTPPSPEIASKEKVTSPLPEKVTKPTIPPAPKVEVASKEKMVFPLPDKPSIAVLPFTNMSDDPEQEYFSDGISEDIITDLSKLSDLIVIARNSSFTYKGKAVNVQQIGQDLKVRYLLEGSVRKAGDQVRINAQLVDASNGQHLWAERYDGRMGDIFALQDGISRKIVSALALKLTASEQKALVDKGTDDPLAYEEYLKGWENYRRSTNESFARAKIHLEKAVELDPEFARAYSALAILYMKAVQTTGLKRGLGLTDLKKVGQASLKSRFLLEKAMKKPTALAYGMISQIYLNMFLHNEALAEIKRAIAMDPNNPELYEWMSKILYFMGKDREAIESAKRAIRLDPNNPGEYLIRLAQAYLPDGDLQESLTLLERAKMLNPERSGTIAFLQSIIYGLEGRTEEARAAYQIFVKSREVPIRNLEELMAYHPFSDLKKSDRIAEALVKAGAPGKPTDYCRVSRDNLLKGPEIKNLLFGHKITGTTLLSGEQFWFEWNRDGDLNVIRGALRDKGRTWIEGDVIFMHFEKMPVGHFYNLTLFRNPDGTKEKKNQYVWVDEFRNIIYFSPAD